MTAFGTAVVALSPLPLALVSRASLAGEWPLVVVAWPRLRRAEPRLTLGRMVGWPLAAAVVLAVATVVALAGFQALVRPDVADLAAGLPVAAFGSLLVAGVCFSTINAVLEELIFRGVLWEATAAEWNRGGACRDHDSLWPGSYPRLSARTARSRSGWNLRIGGRTAAAVDRRVGPGDSRAHLRDATIFTLLFQSGAFEPVAG